jgi:hypothetical protein
LNCFDRVLDAARLVCAAFDGTRTHLFVLEPGGNPPQPIGSLAGHFLSYRQTREGWLSGWVDFRLDQLQSDSGRHRRITMITKPTMPTMEKGDALQRRLATAAPTTTSE